MIWHLYVSLEHGSGHGNVKPQPDIAIQGVKKLLRAIHQNAVFDSFCAGVDADEFSSSHGRVLDNLAGLWRLSGLYASTPGTMVGRTASAILAKLRLGNTVHRWETSVESKIIGFVRSMVFTIRGEIAAGFRGWAVLRLEASL